MDFSQRPGDIPKDTVDLMGMGQIGPVQMSLHLLVLNAVLAFLMGLVLVSAFFVVAPKITTARVQFQVWPYCALPLIFWFFASLLPMWYSHTRTQRRIGQAMEKTAEAYVQRAELSINLNKGTIEVLRPEIVDLEQQLPAPATPKRAIPIAEDGKVDQLLISGPIGPRPDAVYADEGYSELPPGDAEFGKVPYNLGTDLDGTRVWVLRVRNPASKKIEDVLLYQRHIREFVTVLYEAQDWTRDRWVGEPKRGKLRRMQYEALLKLMTDMQVIVGRGKGTTGQLTTRSLEETLGRFGLEPR